MDPDSTVKPFALLGLALAVGLFFYLHTRWLRRWKADAQADFIAALQHLGIDVYDVLDERIINPGRNRQPEVYRILRDSNGRYFLYLYTWGAPGVLSPLAEERALLALNVNG